MPDGKGIDLYGIVNCDQVKKARKWLDAAGHPYRFHDFKKEPPDAALIAGWLATAGWETLVNRRGTTWRALDDAERPVDDKTALRAILRQPSLIKRPVAVFREHVAIGFDQDHYHDLFD